MAEPATPAVAGLVGPQGAGRPDAMELELLPGRRRQVPSGAVDLLVHPNRPGGGVVHGSNSCRPGRLTGPAAIEESSSLPTSTSRAWSVTRPFALPEGSHRAVGTRWVHLSLRMPPVETVGQMVKLSRELVAVAVHGDGRQLIGTNNAERLC
jgi:hypothetical protein